MLSIESSLSKSDRIDFVSIVTPNHLHFDPAIMALEKGFPVIIDKPLSFNSIESNKLQQKVEETGFPFAVTHTYTGYPMVKEAKYLINSGKIGKLRKVAVEYPQGWLSTRLESTDNKQASWRTDPKKSGNIIRVTDLLSNYKPRQRKNIQPIGFVIGDKNLYLTNSDGKIIVADLSDGKITKIEKVSGGLVSEPFIFDNNLFVVRNGSIVQYN